MDLYRYMFVFTNEHMYRFICSCFVLLYSHIFESKDELMAMLQHRSILQHYDLNAKGKEAVELT